MLLPWQSAKSAVKAGINAGCLHAGSLFTLDIFLLFHTGFIITCNLRKRLIMDGYFVARYYAKHASLLVDVLATVPSWIEVSLSACAMPNAFHCMFSAVMFRDKLHDGAIHAQQHDHECSCIARECLHGHTLSQASMLLSICKSSGVQSQSQAMQGWWLLCSL